MSGYYAEHLAAERLRRVYQIAPPAVQAYLRGEIDFIGRRLTAGETALELGCGYGRVLAALTDRGASLWGIDTSLVSLRDARASLPSRIARRLLAMDATEMGFRDGCFHLVFCVQNGISAFGVDSHRLIREALRVTRPGGRLLFSSYADRFWSDRLAWFELQAAEGLIGEIDYRETGHGDIVCRDGFRATTVTADAFRALAEAFGMRPRITVVADSSLFCELIAPTRGD
jgi:2-polyprenyl-6-hydroxyphenyl methylase/3-demethylubiquinone-9 3-methyltransferase